MRLWRERIGLAFGLAGFAILLQPMFDLMSEPGTLDLRWMAGAYALLLLGGAITPK
jgi:hypothetical protein